MFSKGNKDMDRCKGLFRQCHKNGSIVLHRSLSSNTAGMLLHLFYQFFIFRKKQDFSEALRRLESATECQGLPMISFLLLPMQRITRLPLLVDAICHRMDPINDKHRHTSAIKALDALNRVN